MDKKYKILPETKRKLANGRIVFRIQALKTFHNIRKGDIGGWIESEKNLSQKGSCWVYDNAIVTHSAKVKDDAKIQDDAMVAENALICENAIIRNNAVVHDSAFVFGITVVEDSAAILDNASICDYSHIKGYARIHDNVLISGHATVKDNAEIFNNSRIFGYTTIFENAYIRNGNDIIYGNIGKDAFITSVYEDIFHAEIGKFEITAYRTNYGFMICYYDEFGNYQCIDPKYFKKVIRISHKGKRRKLLLKTYKVTKEYFKK